MPTRGQNWQDVQQAALPIIGTAARTENETIMLAVDKHLDMPLRMYASTPVSRVVQIGNIRVEAGDQRRKSIPHIGSIIPAFVSGTVTLPSASGGNITFSTGGSTPIPLTLANDTYVNVLVYLDAAGNLGAYVGTPNASEAALLPPPGVRGTFAVGYIRVFNNAGTIENVSNAHLTQFAGGGGGSGSGNANTLLETFKNAGLDLPYELMTPVVFDNDESAFTDSSSTGAFSVVSRSFEFGSAGQTFVSKQMLDQGEFLDDGLVATQIDLIVAWTPGKVDTAATYWASRDGGANYEQITMERVGNGTDTYMGRLIPSAANADDLRIKIVSSAGSKSLDGMAVFYRNIDAGQMVFGRSNFEVQNFDSNSTNEFTLTRFIPDPALLLAVCDGDTYKLGDFTLDGHKVTFAAGFFDEPVTKQKSILFLQIMPGSNDSSTVNAALLAANHLGSTDPNIDRSDIGGGLGGRGIILRRPDGALREITLDNDDNLVPRVIA